MKIDSIAFTRPVKVRGQMVHSLSISSAVGRLGTNKPCLLTADEDVRFVTVADATTEKILAVVPIGNVDFFTPAEVKAAPPPAPSSKK